MSDQPRDDPLPDEREPSLPGQPSSQAPRKPGRGLSVGHSAPPGWLVRSAIPDLRALARTREQLGWHVATPGVLVAIEQARRAMEVVQEPFLSVAERASWVAFGNSMVTANLAAKWSDTHLAGVLAAIKAAESFQAAMGAQIETIRQISTMVEYQNTLLTRIRPFPDIARPVVFATQAWQDVVRVTPEDGTSRYLDRFEVAGRGTGWAVQAGIALSEPDEARVDALETEATVVLGPAVASAELRIRLHQIHPSLRDRLDGAWERILEGGADASSQAANSLMELIDWTLRLLAPDPEVLAWHAANSRPAKELHEGRPTRGLRVRFAVRDQAEKNSSVDLYLRAILEMVSVIQAPKHMLEVRPAKALTPVALTVEGLLYFLTAD